MAAASFFLLSGSAAIIVLLGVAISVLAARQHNTVKMHDICVLTMGQQL